MMSVVLISFALFSSFHFDLLSNDDGGGCSSSKSDGGSSSSSKKIKINLSYIITAYREK